MYNLEIKYDLAYDPKYNNLDNLRKKLCGIIQEEMFFYKGRQINELSGSLLQQNNQISMEIKLNKRNSDKSYITVPGKLLNYSYYE